MARASDGRTVFGAVVIRRAYATKLAAVFWTAFARCHEKVCSLLAALHLLRLPCLRHAMQRAYVCPARSSLAFAGMAFVPTCPPADSSSAVIEFLCAKGFVGTSAQLLLLEAWLPSHDVVAPVDFGGLGMIRELSGADAFPESVLDFLQSIITVCRLCICRACGLCGRHCLFARQQMQRFFAKLLSGHALSQQRRNHACRMRGALGLR